jgi:oxygen-independent coproporphyrinogen-3 oxidase
MAGIYIHIPFCSKACHYCNFHFSTSLHQKESFVAALLAEIRQPFFPKEVIPERSISTIYFGGGTPSILLPAELDAVLSAIRQHFEVAVDAEITLEANPDDITIGKLNDWKLLGINRLSIGIQSFADADLRWMNRAHNASQAMACIGMAQQAGFHQLSIDLIYGLPHTTTQQWEQNLEQAFNLHIPHLSCYALTVEEKTALHYFIKKGKVPAIDDARQAEQFVVLMQRMQDHGYEQYEISNFAMPGNRSRHNSSYWKGLPYFGFGPSAHSFDGAHTRWWNVANNSLYIQQLTKGLPAFEYEILSASQHINETIMTQLRLVEGLPFDEATQTVGHHVLTASQWEPLMKKVNEYSQNNWLTQSAGHLVLTNSGKLYADHMAAGLFV